MRNLKLQYCKQIAATVPDTKFLLLNPNSDKNHIVYLVTTSKLYAYNLNDGGVEDLAEVPGIVAAEYLALEDQICLATEAGEVLVVDPQTQSINEGTFCDVGIEVMAWSPDQEVVAFVTKTGNVVVMTCTYDPIAEHSLAEQSDEQFVNVGWGRKETQFHGSEGKMAAKQKIDFSPPENINELPQNIEITWRADGAFFAVSFVSPEVGRMFKVFDKEGKMNYTSEKLNHLYPPLAWRPSGTWMAMPHRLPNKSTVALFEKNGLKHREIVLPFQFETEEIVNFKWSPDSDVLAIETRCPKEGKNNLYLYTIGNYHWYLKQLLAFSIEDPIAVSTWDNRIGEEKTLHILLQSGKYFVYRWHFFIDKYERSGIVGVIDGRKLLLTDFSRSVVPPPMSHMELEINGVINACAFMGTEGNDLQLCIYDATGRLHIYVSTLQTPLDLKHWKTLEADKSVPRVPQLLGNLFWITEGHLMASTTQGNVSKVNLVSTNHGMTFKIESTQQLSGTINALYAGSIELEQFYVQTLDGKIHQGSLRADNSIKFDSLYAHIENAADELHWYTSRNFVNCGLIALKTNYCLYINSECIATDVTSFCLAGNYLAYTKLTSLVFVRLTDLQVVSERKIERGGKLITTVTNVSRTILQMPRGNLEAISPRVLALEIVGSLLDRRQYLEAMDMLRKERINLNIICDHDMVSFVENISSFLEEITNPNWLNLFLSDLQNEDFTKTMYASNYTDKCQSYPEGFKIEHKVSYICEKFCERMEKDNAEQQRYRLPIITANVKTNKIEKALDIIWQLKRLDSSGGTKHADEALKYLLYLVDVNDLYNVALGSYDFGLVLFVAQKSQKDPKEFLPFLNELKTFEENYRKFKIDDYLKRYPKALDHIARCGEEKFEEALAFIIRHELYQHALSCYEGEKECYRRICVAFADHLRANGKLENASIMYERGGDIPQAILSAKHVLDWQRALALAAQNKSANEVESVALSLIPSLQENGKYVEAFDLLKTYGQNFVDALRCLVKGRLYLRAIFEARMQQHEESNNNDLIDTIIAPNLLAYRSLLVTNLIADQELFTQYKQRLVAVREHKLKQRLAAEDDFNQQPQNEIDECDLLSDTTSMNSSRYTASSRGTGKTFRSSKNRRKHERKLLSLKPGNPFEDIALIDALYNHVMKIIEQQQHIRDTCKALMELQHDEEARDIQRRFKQLLTIVQDSLDTIWIPEMMTTQQFLTGPNIDYTQLQNEQRYAMINPQKRMKPLLNPIDWEHEILR